MVELTKSEELEVAGNAAFCLACHALDSPVRFLAAFLISSIWSRKCRDAIRQSALPEYESTNHRQNIFT